MRIANKTHGSVIILRRDAAHHVSCVTSFPQLHDDRYLKKLTALYSLLGKNKIFLLHPLHISIFTAYRILGPSEQSAFTANGAHEQSRSFMFQAGEKFDRTLFSDPLPTFTAL
jgi:hypothetical protein